MMPEAHLIAQPNLVDRLVLTRTDAGDGVRLAVEDEVAAHRALPAHRVGMIEVVGTRLEAIGIARERATRGEVDDVALEAGLHRPVLDDAQLRVIAAVLEVQLRLPR